MTRRMWIAAAVCAAAVLLFLAYAYPGYMSADSCAQLGEARSGEFSDWHPPMMAALWRLCDGIVRGPALMLFLQSGAFFAGVIVLVRKRRSTASALTIAGALLVFPPLATTLAVIWKDSQMLGYLALGTALIAPPATRRTRIVGVALLALATAMRHNAFTITFAIIVLLLEPPAWASRAVRRYAFSTVVWLAITLAAFGANSLIADKHMHLWSRSLAMYDVLGTLHYAGPLDDTQIRDTLKGTHFEDTPPLQARVDQAYSPFLGVFKDLQVHFLYQPETDAERAAIARAFRTVVENYPRAYLRHRMRAFEEVISLPPRKFGRVWAWYADSTVFSHEPGPVQAALADAAVWVGDTWLFWPFLYLLASCAVGAFAIRRRDSLVFALAASGVISELALFFLAPNPDFRYSVWLVFTTLLAPWLLPRSPSGFTGLRDDN